MHFEILVEDQSGKKALDILVPKIIGNNHTFNVRSYKGIGRIPKNLTTGGEANKRILKAKGPVLNAYENDSICGTWEHMANAVYNGGSTALSAKGWQAIGAEKSHWAEQITPHMDVTRNVSPSFVYFREKLLELSGAIN